MNSKNQWFKFHLNVICDKCQHTIPFQSIGGSPACEECGTLSESTWLEVLEFSKLQKIKQYKDGSTQLAGFMQLQMNYSAVDGVPCYHCHYTLNVFPSQEQHSQDCQQCHQSIEFVSIKSIPAFSNLFFYFHKNKKTDVSSATVAVRCASCGAPLQVDQSRDKYTCNFCNTLNIIPPSLRAKKVLDDIYIGWNGRG